jgi:tetratricopeptide (TPR) repeat protein
MTQPHLENLAGIELSPEATLVLQRIFARYKRVNIIREFSAGLSGSRVLEVRPIKADGTPELPTVVKLATLSMIQREWQAYQQHIHNRLPHVAAVNQRTLLATAGWGGLRYPLLGSDDQDIVSLGDFFRHPSVSAEQLQKVIERLLRIMDNIWGYHYPTATMAFSTCYEQALPPGLLIRAEEAPEGATPITIEAGQTPPVAPGDVVALLGFLVHKVDPEQRTITLLTPTASPSAQRLSARARLPEGAAMPPYRAQEAVGRLDGVVLETREGRLRQEAAEAFPGLDLEAPLVPLLQHAQLPNPLLALPALLSQVRKVNIATIHGDFNLGNILIASQLEDVSLIDFSEARQDHVLHDLLRLESEIITGILPEIIVHNGLDPALTLAELSWRLHHALANPAYGNRLPDHEALRKPWVALRAIRRAARRYLFELNDRGEYYHGLCLTMLGALRFKSLRQRPEHPLPKQLAFWAAALALEWLRHPGEDMPPSLIGALSRGGALWSPGPGGALADDGQPPEPDTPHSVQPPPSTRPLAGLGAAPLPPGGALPPGSRMLLERNRRFVGRREQLRRLVGALESRRVAVIGGLGGLGKSQLACEFAYRYGRFFSGGVFWLSCADPHAVAAEVAACGEQGAMGLRPTFHELPLAEQVELVSKAWEQPTPRLLIFDNCETPELLARWLPQQGGCHVIVTSRRADWEDVAGLPSIALDVLRRPESLELLREHQPDAESAALDAIAHELGDLPLALHLAGSYLARYRHSTDAAGYLASLRQASPLAHESLKGGLLSPTEHDPHVARTFAVSYTQLAQAGALGELARALIHGAACLAPGEPIPEALARLALDTQHDDTAAEARASLQLGSAITHLIELGLVQAEAGRTFWVHRLVVAFVRDCMGAALERVQAEVEQLLCAEAERQNAQRDPSQLRAIQLHLRFVAEAAAPRGDARAANVSHALAEHLYQSGDYQGARAVHERALSIRRALFGNSHPVTAASLTQLGKVLLFYGDIAHAGPYLSEALAIQSVALGDHSDTATTLNHLGFLHQQVDELEAARRCHEEALRIRSNLLGADHPSVVDSLSNLAFVEYRQNKLDAALSLLEQALAMQRRATGDEHPETAKVLTHIGELYVTKGDAAAASAVLEPALAIQRRELGLEHPETARILLDLGDVRCLSGDRASARSHYQQALAIFRTCHGPDHKRTRWAQRQLDAISASSPAS